MLEILPSFDIVGLLFELLSVGISWLGDITFVFDGPFLNNENRHPELPCIALLFLGTSRLLFKFLFSIFICDADYATFILYDGGFA